MRVFNRHFTMTELLDILNAMVFIGALLYFIATVSTSCVPLGGEQRFCRCSSATVVTVDPISSTKDGLCVMSVEPTTHEQVSGQFLTNYFNVVNRTEFRYNWETQNIKNDCTVTDVEAFKLKLNDYNPSVSFPWSPATAFDCVVGRSAKDNTLEFYVNITAGAPPVKIPSSGDQQITQMHRFHAPTYIVTVVWYTLFTPTLNDISDALDLCVSELDKVQWYSLCVCVGFSSLRSPAWVSGGRVRVQGKD